MNISSAKLPSNILQELASTITQLAASGKGLLAADESTATITKRFSALGITSNEDTRKAYRELLLTTPDINQFISGVILYEETLDQITNSGVSFSTLLNQLNIVPGIKVDKGLVPLPNTLDEKITQGLDGLYERLTTYKNKGARFAKWRAVYSIAAQTPSSLVIKTNANDLARYAVICQSLGIVPIVEPEVLIDGNHTLEMCAEITESVLQALFHALFKYHAVLEYTVLKPSMIIAGNQSSQQNSPQQVATATVEILKRTVPAAIPTINFLSGGQTPQQATANLNEMHLLNNNEKLPWNLSFSYARALQEPCMKAWLGKNENKEIAQQAFYKRSQLASLASLGKYNTAMEK